MSSEEVSMTTLDVPEFFNVVSRRSGDPTTEELHARSSSSAKVTTQYQQSSKQQWFIRDRDRRPYRQHAMQILKSCMLALLVCKLLIVACCGDGNISK